MRFNKLFYCLKTLLKSDFSNQKIILIFVKKRINRQSTAAVDNITIYTIMKNLLFIVVFLIFYNVLIAQENTFREKQWYENGKIYLKKRKL